MPDTFRVIVRRSFVQLGVPRVGREVVGVYKDRREAETACADYLRSHGDSFRPDYDDCIIELDRADDMTQPDR